MGTAAPASRSHLLQAGGGRPCSGSFVSARARAGPFASAGTADGALGCYTHTRALLMPACRSSSKANAKPPEKGSFPLDHFHECKAFMEKYMACMKREANTHAACREETKACVPLPAATLRSICARTQTTCLYVVSMKSLVGSKARSADRLCPPLLRASGNRYLQCRMNNGLMTQEDMSKFGLNDKVQKRPRCRLRAARVQPLQVDKANCPLTYALTPPSCLHCLPSAPLAVAFTLSSPRCGVRFAWRMRHFLWSRRLISNQV